MWIPSRDTLLCHRQVYAAAECFYNAIRIVTCKCIANPPAIAPEPSLECREPFFNRVEVWAIGRKKDQSNTTKNSESKVRTGRKYSLWSAELTEMRWTMDRAVVHDEDRVLLWIRVHTREDTFDKQFVALGIHRTFSDKDIQDTVIWQSRENRVSIEQNISVVVDKLDWRGDNAHFLPRFCDTLSTALWPFKAQPLFLHVFRRFTPVSSRKTNCSQEKLVPTNRQ